MRTVDKICENARNQPRAAAIVDGETVMTYGDLLKRAGSVAEFLTNSTEPGRSVGIGMAKSAEAGTAMLGAALAGRPYVPLDPALPPARRRLIVEDCRPGAILVACEKARKQLVAETVPAKVAVFQEATAIKADAFEPVEAERLAILYTSGTTSRPKGVVLGAAALDTFVDWATRYFGLGREDRIASHAPFGFDISLLDFWAGLAAGATVHLVPEGHVANGAYLAAFLEERRITFWQSVPTAIEAIAGALDEASRELELRQLCSTGEVMSCRTRELLDRFGGGVTFHNVYGCTETNDTFVFTALIDEVSGNGDFPIGNALDYVTYRIVDEDGDPVSQGEQGELLVRSGAAFLGYTNAALTEAAHCSVEGLPHYRTRDLVIEDADNLLHFVGRIDHTVKLRGVRVDLREVEATLCAEQRIRDAVAFVLPCERKGKQLVAMISGPEAAEIPVLELKVHCARHLARQSIPDRFLIGPDPLPRNANGKTDRNAAQRIAAVEIPV